MRRPLEDLVATLRTLQVTPDPATGTDGLQALWWEADSLGQPPMAWPLPNGYPDTATAWQSTNGDPRALEHAHALAASGGRRQRGTRRS